MSPTGAQGKRQARGFCELMASRWVLLGYGRDGSIQRLRHVVRSFSMLTVNADDHAFMRNYQKSQDEKRMVVILQEDEYDAWLAATPGEGRHFFRQFPAELMQGSSKAAD